MRGRGAPSDACVWWWVCGTTAVSQRPAAAFSNCKGRATPATRELGYSCLDLFPGDTAMACGPTLLLRLFGRPKGLLGRFGGLIMAWMNRAAAEEVIGLLDVGANDRILEIGFGPGVAIQLLVQRLPHGSIAGVDSSLEMMRQAAARNATAVRHKRVDLRHGGVEELPFADATFDKALSINSMQVWPDAAAGLREIGRVLKPAGRIALGFTVNSGQPKASVCEALAAAGFVRTRMVERSRLFCAIATKP